MSYWDVSVLLGTKKLQTLVPVLLTWIRRVRGEVRRQRLAFFGTRYVF